MIPLRQRFRAVGVPTGGRGHGLCIAQDRVLGCAAVLKFAPSGTETAASLGHEGALLADLEHPRLVRLVRRFEDEPGLEDDARITGFATRWVDGAPLVEGLSDRSRGERLQAFGQLLQVVAYLHRRGLLHLDLKPHNALWTDQGVVLLDLGSARPLDGKAGESGGTLGYASPEVLAGLAPAVASDLYSLGVILYELLTGRQPHGGLQGRALRQAMLGGEVVPVRAVSSEVPRPLARLTEDLLALQPASRPSGVDEVMERLRASGQPVLAGAPGAPPYVGREREAEALEELLAERENSPVAVLGDLGSGRSRFCRRELARLGATADLAWIDLGQADDVVLALHRLLALADPDVPPRGPGWAEAVRRLLARGRPLAKGVLFLGRREDLSPGDAAILESVAPALAEAGVRVLWAASRPPVGFRPLPLAPLHPVAVEAIGAFFGVPFGPRLQDAAEAAGWQPGPLGRALALRDEHVAELAAPLLQVLRDLASLPSRIPEAVVGRLPQEHQDALPALLSGGLARWLPGQGLVVRHAVADQGVAPAVQAAVRAACQELPDRVDPLWAALACARMGDEAAAIRLFPVAATVEGRVEERLELAHRLASTGHPAATLLEARLHEQAGRPDQVLVALERAPSAPGALLLRARALRALFRHEGALAAAREAWAAEADPRAALEEAWCAIHLRDPSSADEALKRALAAGLAPADALHLQLRAALLRMVTGEGSVDPEPLIRQAEATEAAPAAVYSSAAALCARRRQASRGLSLARRAAAAADHEGDLVAATEARLNLGNLLQQCASSSEARRAYADALLMARAIRRDSLRVRLCYSIAELDLRAGRVPAAERHLAELREVVGRHPEPEALARVAILQAWIDLLKGRPEDAHALLAPLEVTALPQVAMLRALFLGRALVELGRHAEALEVLDAVEEPGALAARRQFNLLRGRAHLGIGRAHLARAGEGLPDDPDPIDRLDVGQVLLGAAGEDLDPTSLAGRRRNLDRAARLLRGPAASRAANLRDRLLDAPGATLESVVDLTEAMHDPTAFPPALARLVAEALGAHRALIMLRMPGLGQQLTYKEISGQEAAGIGVEVLRRIQAPGDVWLAADAFADPQLREASATVRTFEIKSLLAVAIPSRGRSIGALYVDDLHRTGRFDERDVRVMQRLAGAVGKMIGLIPTATGRQPLLEPSDVLGVLLSDPAQVAAIEDVTSVLRHQRETNLLVTGPTGAGKTWFARRVATEVLGLQGIEEVVLRKGDTQMLVSQLMGTRRGEYTGAVDQVGAIQRAIHEKRALFLDEIQTLDHDGQQILLPLLELPHRRFGGLTGSARPIGGRLHIILGTNVPVGGNLWVKHFRNDLWFRMCQSHVDLPPLAARGPEVVYRYLQQMLKEHGARDPEHLLEIAALHRVSSYAWPGNLRELHAFAGRLAVRSRELRRRLDVADLSRCGLPVGGDEEAPKGGAVLETIERDALLQAMRRVAWVQAEAARQLGMSKWKLRRALKRHGLLDVIRARREAAEGREPV